MSLTIGMLATAAGVKLETVRYYERIKLMPEPSRTASGHRAYDGEHLRRLRFIRRGRELGFSIEDIRTLLGLAAPSESSCGEVREIAEAHLSSVRNKLADLRRLEFILVETISGCSTNGDPSCPVLEMLADDH
jgi:MerR family mercuric resistance operon transcriptional regulator